MYKAKHFKIQELVDEKTYKARGIKAWELIDPELITVIDALRETFGSAYINTWYFKRKKGQKGGSQWRGLRPKYCTIGAAYSQHRLGKGADITFKNISAEDVRKAIKNDKEYWIKKGIKSIENGVNWLHVDVRNCKAIKYFTP